MVIRTNGGTLEINAFKDKVKHYGEVESLNIVTVAPTSYHEFGKVGYAKIANGRLVVEEGSEIDGIFLVADANDLFNGIKLAVVGSATLPPIARAEVSLSDGQSKLVVEVQTLKTSDGTDPNPQYVWITKAENAISSVISSSASVATEAVGAPSPAANAARQTTQSSATPINDNCVARIGAVGYEKLGLAFVNVKAEEKIVLLKDLDTQHLFLYKHDYAATFDLGGHTLRTYGMTESSDNEANGYAAGGRSIRVYGDLTVQNGVIDGRNYSVSNEEFTLTPKTSKSWGINNVGGCVRIESGTTVLNNLVMYNNDGWGTAVSVRDSSGHVKMSNCEIHSIYGSCVDIYGDSTISNCKFYQHFIQTGTSSAWLATCIGMGYGAKCDVYNSETGQIIEDDEIQFTEGTGVDALSVFSSGGTLNVYGGTFSASRYVIHLWPDSDKTRPSVINIYDGDYTGDFYIESDPSNLCSINVYDGTFTTDVSNYQK